MEFSPTKKIKTPEEVRTQIEARIEEIKTLPIQDSLYDMLEQELRAYIENSNPAPEEKERMQEIIQWFDDATIGMETLTEYRMAFEALGCPESYINDMIEHENAHANKATSLKAKHKGYSITLSYDETSDEYVVHPKALISLPEAWSDWRKNRAGIAITRAPQDYGNSLSDKDEEDLERLFNERASLRIKKK